MKKLILIALAFVSIQAFAQPGDRDGRRGQGQKMKNLTAKDMAELGTKKLTLDLDLSEDQKSEVQAILLEEGKFRKQKMQEHQAIRENIEEARPSKEERLEMEKEKLDRQIAMKEKMKSVLNDEQYAEWESNMEERKSQRKGKRGKGEKRRN